MILPQFSSECDHSLSIPPDSPLFCSRLEEGILSHSASVPSLWLPRIQALSHQLISYRIRSETAGSRALSPGIQNKLLPRHNLETAKNVPFHSYQVIPSTLQAYGRQLGNFGFSSIDHPFGVPVKWRTNRWVDEWMEEWTSDHHTQQLERWIALGDVPDAESLQPEAKIYWAIPWCQKLYWAFLYKRSFTCTRHLQSALSSPFPTGSRHGRLLRSLASPWSHQLHFISLSSS